MEIPHTISLMTSKSSIADVCRTFTSLPAVVSVIARRARHGSNNPSVASWAAWKGKLTMIISLHLGERKLFEITILS